MEELAKLKKRLQEERPVEWDAFPDIGLYMDQIISYLPRQLIHYEEGETLTSAMVNNYIKDGALPRAEGKRYSRTHLAYLTAICALKRVLSVRDTGRLLAAATAEEPRALYDLFRRELDAALNETAERLGEDETELAQLALSLALRSYADQLACERVLELLTQRQPKPPEKPERQKKKNERDSKPE